MSLHGGYPLRMLTTFHPTKRLLVDTVAKLLESKSQNEISAEEVLEASGVSRGSMYHHFKDFPELIETAQISRYTKWIDSSIDFLTLHVATARTQKDLRKSLRILTELTQSDDRKGARAERAQALSACMQNPRMEEQMGKETQRLTEAIADVTNEVKNKGLFREDVDSRTLATFIQAYSLGKIVNDYNPTGVSEEEWVEFIMKIIDHTFMAPSKKE
jgi:AcrR family transcriptional regulator